MPADARRERHSHPIEDPDGAFCHDTDAYLEGAPGGPLSGLTFGAKDIFDVAGHVTGAGNPDWKATHGPADTTAWAVKVLVEAGATMVGKTVTEELTHGIFGDNSHYGTPANPRAPDRVPGGSSSGSASAVAAGLVDFALGSDTGGSVRVPASYCGLYGLRPTHGRIPLDGMLKHAPSYDTVGWFARDAATFARVGDVLLRSRTSDSQPGLLVIAEDAFEIADREVADALKPAVETASSLLGRSTTARLAEAGLDEWRRQRRVLQGREGWETGADWIDRVNPRLTFSVAEGYVNASTLSDAEVEVAGAACQAYRERVDEALGESNIVCLPTTPTPAPPRVQRLSERRALGERKSMLTCIAGIAGGPQISVPVAEVDGLPVGLSLIGPRGSDETLIALAGELGRGSVGRLRA